ncbi:MAG TPA: cbb3-type cytochrome c oxidase subunit I, partial [Ilumatobacteraceae bacterium]|nr:cbb3-type cytochrome c oxidase subunit I [Ilumatobacteraceae bacterium]
MTTIDPTAHVESLTDAPARSAAGSTRLSALLGWLTTSDHKRLGRMLFGSGLAALIAIAVVGALLGIDRADTGLLGSGTLAQLFAVHRIGLAYFAILPIVLGVAVAIVPLQLGARSLAVPRLAAAGFWAWLIGSILVIVSLIANGGPLGGETKMVSLFIASYGVVLAGLFAIALALATTVLTTRAPGMNMRRIPLFSWSVLIASLGLVLVLPVALGTVVYLWVSYRYNRQPFGGNAGLLGNGPQSSANWLGFTLTQPVTFLYA